MPSASRSSSATRWVADSRRAVSRPMPRAAPVTTATGRSTTARLLGARHAVAAGVLLVLGALAQDLRNRERDQPLHERREDDEEHDDEAERGRPRAEAEDHGRERIARYARARRSRIARWRVRWCSRSLNVAASDATTTIAQPSSSTSSTLVAARSGLGSEDETVSSCVLVQNSASK